jgi:nitrous oxidase accessory protein
MGLGFKESERVVVTGNHLADDTTGIYLDNTPQKIGGTAEFSGNVVAGNDVGIRFHGPQHGARFSANTLDANGLSVTVDGNSDALGSTWDGNSWSDYAGYDLDGDGYGDLPFELTSLTGELRQRRPELAFFQGTPAAALLDLFAAAFPMFAPRPILHDPRPTLVSR